MSEARFLVGDVLEQLATLPDNTADLVLTSPPFLALRSYLPADHPQKHLEGGSQSTPGEYIDWLVEVVEALDRVLAPHGSLCFELGDTYAGSGGAGGDYDEDGLREDQPKFRQNGNDAWPLAKSLTLIPELFRLTLVYGTNPLTGRTTEPWRLRNVIRWVRPNPPVGALGDKFRPATSELIVFCKSEKRYFDLDAVRTEHMTVHVAGERKGMGGRLGTDGQEEFRSSGQNPNGAPPLDWWQIPTHPYKGAHYATWPPELCVKPIKAMCPERVCRECGEPSRRIVGEAEYERTDTDRVPARLTMLDGERPAVGVNQHLRSDGANTSVVRQAPTVGWSDCGHDNWRPGLILDPFAGTGTVGMIATGNSRDAILIDIDERNLELARQRIGMFLVH